jgi:hypothetical protein
MVNIHPYLVEFIMQVGLMVVMGTIMNPYIKAMHKGIEK